MQLPRGVERKGKGYDIVRTLDKGTVVELTADKVHFCGSKDATQKPTQTFTEISEDDGGDLPF